MIIYNKKIFRYLKFQVSCILSAIRSGIINTFFTGYIYGIIQLYNQVSDYINSSATLAVSKKSNRYRQ